MNLCQLSLVVAAFAVLAGCGDEVATNPKSESMEKPRNSPVASTNEYDPSRPVDNSGQNKTDKDGHSVTPLDQGDSSEDIAITKQIRKTLTGDESMSVNAQNVKIITAQGVVVLRGPVASQAECDRVLKVARETNGVLRIDNHITVP